MYKTMQRRPFWCRIKKNPVRIELFFPLKVVFFFGEIYIAATDHTSEDDLFYHGLLIYLINLSIVRSAPEFCTEVHYSY